MTGRHPLNIGVEATSLLGTKTGIGAMTKALLERFGAEPGLGVTALVISWRGRWQVGASLPPGIESQSLVFPARLAHQLWQHLDWPSVNGFDVVHGPNFVVPPSAGGAEVISVHDFGPWHFPELVTRHARAYPRLVKRALDRGAHVHVDSAFVEGEAEEILGIESDRIHVVRLGFDPQEQGVGARGRERIGAPYVLALGTIEPRKDLPTLVRAMAEVRGSLPDLKLVVAGPDGWGTEVFEGSVQHNRLGDRVIRLGYVSDVERADLLAGAVCLAYPSIYEGFGLPPLEAMAASTPVITTRAGSLPEVCGSAALYVEPQDASGLAAAIIEVVEDEVLAKALAVAGTAHIEGFSWDRAATEMLDLYRQLAPPRS
ncbi:MAG: glycosyltransferase family 4 protein [Actinomycetia bacterium]|nr:glycosyltransferase family 4 protein [Actinomycetes bacterium]MCP5033983.1 glycosyltransferase family 4 protein [Actinomycetes bacterium]